MKFNIGDSVIFDPDFSYNKNIYYDKSKSYIIVNIHYSKDSKEVTDIFINIDPNRPLYHKRFLLDVKKTRKEKLKNIYDNK
jgi:hypothetical protein